MKVKFDGKGSPPIYVDVKIIKRRRGGFYVTTRRLPINLELRFFRPDQSRLSFCFK